MVEPEPTAKIMVSENDSVGLVRESEYDCDHRELCHARNVRT